MVGLEEEEVMIDVGDLVGGGEEDQDLYELMVTF